MVSDIGGKLCYVAHDFEELGTATSSRMDGSSPSVANGKSSRKVVGLDSVTHLPRFRVPEVLFRPGMLGLEAHDIYETACVCRSFLRH